MCIRDSPIIPPHAPSKSRSYWFPDLETIPFTTDEIYKLIRDFGIAARFAKACLLYPSRCV